MAKASKSAETDEQKKENDNKLDESVKAFLDATKGTEVAEEAKDETPKDDPSKAAPPVETIESDAGEVYAVYPKDDPAKAQETHEKRLAKYGQNYQVATKGVFQRVFSQKVWAELQKGNTDWKASNPMPAEVVAHYKSKKK